MEPKAFTIKSWCELPAAFGVGLTVDRLVDNWVASVDIQMN